MPSLTYDSQSFIWNGRRLWMVGANLEYALLPAERWRPALQALKRMGFNTIRASAPWCLHEPREGRMDFTGSLNVAAFLGLCRELGLHAVLRIGPAVGEAFDGGGLPAWLADQPDIKLRVTNETFLKHVAGIFQAIGRETAPLQATVEAPRGAGFAGGKPGDGGPLCAVQIENGWTCGNESEGRQYHAELLRFARESGFTVPVLTSNGLWISVEGCVEVWEGWNDLFANVRQLRSIQPDAPRLVEIRRDIAGASARECGASARAADAPGSGGWSGDMDNLRRMGQVLCAGGQSIVQQGDARSLRRIAGFADSFGFVLAGADAARQSAVQNLDALAPGSFAVVTVEGNGKIMFVFRGPDEAGKPRRDAATIIAPCGVRMSVRLGDAPLGWYVSDVHLPGAGVLNFCSLSPFALVERKMLVLQGAAGAGGVLSVDGAEVEFTVPPANAGAKPLVFAHQKLTVAVCNQQQIDTALVDAGGLVVGADELHGAGEPRGSKGSLVARLAPGFNKAIRIAPDGTLAELRAAAPPRQAERSIKEWRVAECDDFVAGTSDRFATLNAPQSLARCGVSAGWGWYRCSWKPNGKASAAASVHFPQALGFMRAWHNGRPLGVLGEKGAQLPLTFSAGKSAGRNASGRGRASINGSHASGGVANGGGFHTLTLLARQGGRSAGDAVRNRAAGIFGEALQVTPLKVSAKVIDAPSADPFQAAAFLPGVAPGHHMSTRAAHISFDVRGGSAVTLDAPGVRLRAVAVLNGTVIDFLDWHGGLGDALTLPAASVGSRGGLKSGANELVLVPAAAESLDEKSDQACAEKLAKSLRFFQSPQPGAGARWSFARWDPPDRSAAAWKPLAGIKPGQPRWFAASLAKPDVAGASISILCKGLSRGHVLLNGRIAGEYDAAAGRTRVELPSEAMSAENSLCIFDVEGRSPAGVKMAIVE